MRRGEGFECKNQTGRQNNKEKGTDATINQYDITTHTSLSLERLYSIKPSKILPRLLSLFYGNQLRLPPVYFYLLGDVPIVYILIFW